MGLNLKLMIRNVPKGMKNFRILSRHRRNPLIVEKVVFIGKERNEKTEYGNIAVSDVVRRLFRPNNSTQGVD